MSPELFNSKPYGRKSDVWGLGCVLYELAHNGRHAFDAQSINGLCLKVLKGRYTPVAAACGEDIRRLVKQMLCTNPERRPELPEILRGSAVRRQIPAALEAAVSAAGGEPERARGRELLREQLAGIGLSPSGDVVGEPPPTHGAAAESDAGTSEAAGSDGPRGGRRRRRRPGQLQQRLDHAERRTRREEETLRRLTETAELLQQHLVGPPQRAEQRSSRPPEVPPLQPFGGSPTPCGAGGYGVPPLRASLVPRPLPLAPRTDAASDAGGGSLTSTARDQEALTHRDRVLRRKEQRREEEQQRYLSLSLSLSLDIYIYIYIYIYTHIMYKYKYIYIYIYICIISLYIYIHIYTHMSASVS